MAAKRKPKKPPLDGGALAYFEELAKAKGLKNITVTEHLDNPGVPVIVDHERGLFLEVHLRRVDIPLQKVEKAVRKVAPPAKKAAGPVAKKAPKRRARK